MRVCVWGAESEGLSMQSQGEVGYKALAGKWKGFGVSGMRWCRRSSAGGNDVYYNTTIMQ